MSLTDGPEIVNPLARRIACLAAATIIHRLSVRLPCGVCPYGNGVIRPETTALACR
jgi:hypothetical protein